MKAIPKEITIKITSDMVNEYIRVSKDNNSIHHSTAAAQLAGFSKPIVHGMLVMALGSKLISPMLQQGWYIKLYQLKFITPLYIADILTITTKTVNKDTNQLSLQIQGMNQFSKRIVKGKLIIEQLIQGERK